MNDPKLTPEKFEILKLVNEICKKNRYRLAPVKELVEIVTSQRNVRDVTVRKMIWKLSKEGYLENPLRGCWRLTKKGRNLLRKVG